MSSLRKFLYRFPRFEVSNRVDFICGNAIVLGVCVEISETGLSAAFSNIVLPGTEGLLTLYTGERSFSAHAVVLAVNKEEVTARFQFQSPQEENSIREFIKLLSANS